MFLSLSRFAHFPNFGIVAFAVIAARVVEVGLWHSIDRSTTPVACQMRPEKK